MISYHDKLQSQWEDDILPVKYKAMLGMDRSQDFSTPHPRHTMVCTMAHDSSHNGGKSKPIHHHR